MNLSPLIATCEEVWKSLQKFNQDIPDVVIVVGSGGRRASTLLGHFAKNTWGSEENEIHEVLLVAENLNREAKDVFTTLLHEAVHGIANTRGIKDVSGQRHNKKFANLCEEVGMTSPKQPDPRLGYSAARLTEELEEHFSHEIEMLDEQLKLCRKLFVKEKQTNKTTWIAECGCARKVRLPKKTISDPDFLFLQCGICSSDFTLSDEERDSFIETAGV
jgi:hypothetical protein